MTQENIETAKWKTLQLHPMNHPQPTPPITTPPPSKQQQNPSSPEWMKITKMLVKMKKSPGQQTMMTIAKDTGTQSTILTEAQKLCLKCFEAHHKAWNARNQ
jgi:hypothetical protein